MEIIKYPDSRLRTKSAEVSLPLSKEDKALLDEMYAYVKEHTYEAVGLSAIQIGVAKRMCAIRFTGEKTSGYKLVNPRIIKHSNDLEYMPEGCLSIDKEYSENVPRWKSISVMAYDVIQNKTIIINASGWQARVLQHEIDHMNGILFIDRIC